MLENIIVFVIVCVAVFFTCQRLYRNLSKKDAKCGCPIEGGCPGCVVPDRPKGNEFGCSPNEKNEVPTLITISHEQ